MSKLKKTKIIYLMVVLAVIIAGVSLLWQMTHPSNQLNPNDILSVFGEDIYFTYTDDNSDEDLIIKSDKKTYQGFNQDIVYFNITNTRYRTELVDLQVHFDNEQANVADIAQWDSNSHNWLSLADVPLVLMKEDLITKKRTEYLAESKQTSYFKMAINYPALSQGEFYIEAQGAKGGYGLLDPWYNSSWSYRKRITIEADQVATTTDRARFPVLATTTDSDLASHARSDAYDIVFTDATGNTTLNYEREKWDSGTGEIVAWIQADISSTTDTVLYMYYGNSGQSTDLATTTGVWEDSYKGVWHLPHNTTASTSDSTKYDNDGTTGGTATSTADGWINGGFGFDGTDDYVDVGDMNVNDPLTVSLWFKTSSCGDYEPLIGDFDGMQADEGWQVTVSSAGQLEFNSRTSAGLQYEIYDYYTACNGEWHFIAVRVTDSQVYWWYDGATETDDLSGTGSIVDSQYPVRIGTNEEGFYLQSITDEVRISNIIRSAQWIATEYNNQSAVSEFLTFGAEEDNTPTEFISTIQQSGGDYSRLYDWEDAVECNLTATSTRVFSGSLTGALDENNTVELYRGGADTGIDASVVATTSSQILVDGITGDISDGLVAQSGDLWRKDASNYWTITGTTNDELGDTAIATAKIDGAWSSADTTLVAINGWTTDSAHYIKIYTTEAARHDGKWNTSKYRLTVSAGLTLGIISNNVRIDGLQLAYTGSGNTEVMDMRADNTQVSNCIIKNKGDNGNYENRGVNFEVDNLTSYFYNNIIYDTTNGFNHYYTTGGTTYLYNNTVVNSGIGIKRTGSVTVVAKNNTSYNNSTDYTGTFDSASTHNLSKDNTAPAYGTYYRNKTVNFVDEANDDFHLAQNDTAAKNQGTNLTNDSNLPFSDDIDGDERPSAGSALGWDIGADEETERKTIVNAPHTNKLTSGLVGYWSFDGQDMDWSQTTAEARDQSGQGNHGDVIGAVATIGQVGQALEFDGSDDCVITDDMGSPPAGGLPAISISTWIYPYSDGQYSAGRIAEILYRDYFCVNNEVSGTVKLYGKSTAMTVSSATSQTSTTIPLNSWSHVISTYDDNGDRKVHIYIDGQEASYSSQVAADGDRHGNDCPLGIGVGTNHNSYYFDGLIDEVRVYNRALSADEIKDLYQAGARKFQVNTPITQKYTSGLVGHWTFNGQDMDWASTTAEALDRSGNSNNGNVVNGATPAIGISGQALEFDGVDDYVDVSSLTELSNNTWSVAGWFYVEDTDMNTIVYGWITTRFNERFNIYTNSNDLRVLDDYSLNPYTPGALIQSNQWYHFAVTYDYPNQITRIYVDGVEQASDTSFSQAASSSLGRCHIGWAEPEIWDTPFNGLIDEVRIYNRALSAEEIKELYNLGVRKFQAN